MDLVFIDKTPILQSYFFGLFVYDKQANQVFDLKHKDIFPSKIQNGLTKYYEITSKSFNNGTLFWFLILIIIYMVILRIMRKKHLKD